MTRPSRLPPFGKARQARGPGLVLIVPGTRDGWATAKLYPSGDVLVMPLGHDPAAYTWPVQDCEVVLYTEVFDEPMTKRAVEVLERAGAAVIDCYSWRSAGQGAA